MALRVDTADLPSGGMKASEREKCCPPKSQRSGQGVLSLSKILVLIALVYALIAGLRTVADPDLGWQLATGRWIVEHRSVPSTDVLSFTARGREWIYPALSQVVLYGSYVLGGYALLSWLGAAACVGTVALLLRRGGAVTALLALIAVPLIAPRTGPRAEMFTEVMFAAFVSLLWHYHRSGYGKLWLMPVLMGLWVNLHLGFIAGLGICVAYVALEIGDAMIANKRAGALHRLRQAAPWLAATAAATLSNPWGARIYIAVARQSDVMGTHSRWIREWSGLRLTAGRLMEIFDWREPNSGLWWLILTAVVAAVCAASMRRIVPALLLAASAYLVIHALRMKAPFAAVVVVVGGSLIADAIRTTLMQRLAERLKSVSALRAETLTVASLAAVVWFTAVRVSDLVTNRYYLSAPQQFSAFGAGESYWYPSDAAAFVLREQLPANIFNDYSSGGFLTWALSPSYLDYIDGRAIPFGDAFFVHAKELLGQPLDSPAWQLESDSRNLNMVFVSTDPEMSGSLDELGAFCSSRWWRPVYLDPQAAIFVRVKPENAALLTRLQIDCSSVRFDRPPAIRGSRGRAEAFHYYLNAAYIFLVLEKPAEALDFVDQAGILFADSRLVHFTRGIAFQKLGRWPEAELELHISSELGSENATMALAAQYEQLGRYGDEVRVLGHAAERSDRPHLLYLRLGFAQLAVGRPHEALSSFDRAEKESPFVGEAATLGEAFRAQVEEGRRRAQRAIGQR